MDLFSFIILILLVIMLTLGFYALTLKIVAYSIFKDRSKRDCNGKLYVITFDEFVTIFEEIEKATFLNIDDDRETIFNYSIVWLSEFECQICKKNYIFNFLDYIEYTAFIKRYAKEHKPHKHIEIIKGR